MKENNLYKQLEANKEISSKVLDDEYDKRYTHIIWFNK